MSSEIRQMGFSSRTVEHGVLLAYGVGAALVLLHSQHQVHVGHVALSPLLHWLRDSTLALPIALLAATAGSALSTRAHRWAGLREAGMASVLVWALPTAMLYAAVVVPATFVHALVFPSVTVDVFATAWASAPVNAAVAVLTGLAMLLLVRGGSLEVSAVLRSLRRPVVRRRALALAVVPTMVGTLLAIPVTGTVVPEKAEAASPACDATTKTRDYDVAAINVHLAYNRWGQQNEDAQIYVLQHDKEAVRDWHKPLDSIGSNRRLRPRPLVIRANEGECVAVRFTNELDVTQGEGLPDNPRASMFVRGVPFDVKTSGGSHVGYNPDTSVARGETVTYYWKAPTEGIYFFNDSATPAGSEGDGGSLGAGLYGAFVVEPAGSTWTDPISGDPLYTGTLDQSGELYIDAVIAPPDGKVFRESIQLAQDEMPHTSGFGFNYGSEDSAVRMEHGCSDCVGEETSLSSWVYGDPALVKLASGFGPWLPDTPAGEENCGLGTEGFKADSCFTSNVTHAYKGDPIKFRYGMAGVKETHVFHMHAHTWLNEDKDVGKAGSTPTKPTPDALPESNTIDSQTFGPMEMFTADLLYGAGSKNGTVGDSIFHCHLYPHFVAGFWSLFRVHDVKEDGSNATPDGIKVPALKPLPTASAPDAPTADNPGFPRFIPGKFGWRAPQAPLSITREGVPEPRFVAGEKLDAASPEVQLEQAVMDRMTGGASKPGSPFNDPCPTGAREVTYNVSAIQLKTVYNERGDFDSQTRMLVLDRDVDAVLSGRKEPEPLFARVNAGDCVNWKLTNRLPNWFGNDAFQQLTQTNMFGQHIHLVKFDVMASDGATNGWNYQQAAFSGEQDDFNDQIATNPASCTEAKCRLDLPQDLDPFTSSRGLAPGQTITERWFADYELRTVFTHDHHFAAVDQNRGQYGALVVEPNGMDFRNPVTGAWYQPVNDPAHGATCVSSCVGGASGTSMDVIGPGADDDFREFGLAIADFVPLTRGGGDPQDPNDALNPPPTPEPFPNEDPGVMAVNYRNAPLELRQEKNGQKVDPAYMFSSHVFGDPKTPVLQTYNGDNVRVRLIQGSQEEQHNMLIHGVKWKREPDDPQSHYVDTLPVGISEAFNFEVPRLGCDSGRDCRGDYLYTSTSVDDMWMGMWGIMRVNGGKVPNLLPLPDNPQNATTAVPSPSPTALEAPPRVGPGNPCPAGAPRRAFEVVAMQTSITYNKDGDHDPYGLVYALAEDEATIRAGKNPEPLVLRANEGDCIEVNLHNKLTPEFQNHRGEGDARLPGLPINAVRVPGLRVSMHAGLLKYDVRGSDGATVGYNRDQTVGPGKQILYRWYADQVTPGEVGAVNLLEYGDVLGHRHHGLFGGLIIEPKGATWHDQVTGAPLAAGGAADIRVRGGDDFRESALFFQDGLNLRRANGTFIEDPVGHPPVPGEALEPPEDGLDPEDSGEKAFSYRTEPFRNRMGFEAVESESPSGAALADVYDSHQHGDPATPIVRAYEGDRLKMRILMGSDKPRQHAFGLAGHSFRTSPEDPGSRTVGTVSGLGVNSAINADMGRANSVGDYLYGCAVGFFHRSGGLWGMLRVYPAPTAAAELRPTGIGEVDDPAAGGHPLLPLDLDQVVTTVFHDADRDGVKDAGERPVQGAELGLTSAAQELTSSVSGDDGLAYLSMPPGGYGLTVTPPTGYEVGSAPTSVRSAGDNDVVGVTVALQEPADPGPTTAAVRARAFDDRDRDRVRDAGEPTLSGVKVTASQGGVAKASAVTGSVGLANLEVRPGTYTLAVTPPRGYRVLSVPRSVTTGSAGTLREVAVSLRREVAPRPATLRARVFLDRDDDRRRDRGEAWIARTRVKAVRGGDVVSASTSSRRGTVNLRVPARMRYALQVRPPRRFVVSHAPRSVRAGAPGTRRIVWVALDRRR